MPTRHPNGNPHPVPVSASKDLPSPPPTFVGLTDDDPSHIDPFLSTPEAVRRHLAQLKKQKKPYTMDLTIMAGKKKVHKSACIRDRCKRRFKEAVRMVVVRAARKVENAPGGIAVRYCYIVSIDLEMYRYPLPDLVEHVRTALLELKRKAEQAALEAQLEDLEISPRARQPDESSH
ncbi:small nuclear ribonucleoprotein polypeptide A [Rhodotorula toruloides]|uniref:Small nuclear ribonucleoprotein polypeptide A n=1 Tax=Rhodotorula toruloides TaxID=5286 RepID=A0A511KG44_RHOTO|nr:small nuclear ribonucleoprotein polypeptide A [Rhodotorula toruloides]